MLASSLSRVRGRTAFPCLPCTTLSAPHSWRAIVGTAGYLTMVGALAVAFGFVIRSTAGGITALFGLLLVLPGIGQLLPPSWQSHILPYLPSNAGSAMYSAQPDPTALSPGTGFLVLLIWVIVALASAAVLLKRRDASDRRRRTCTGCRTGQRRECAVALLLHCVCRRGGAARTPAPARQ
jgi:hypothetical protein